MFSLNKQKGQVTSESCLSQPWTYLGKPLSELASLSKCIWKWNAMITKKQMHDTKSDKIHGTKGVDPFHSSYKGFLIVKTKWHIYSIGLA